MSSVFVAFFFFVCCWSSAQTSLEEDAGKPTIIGVQMDYGFLIKHSSSLKEIDTAYPSALGVDWGKVLLTQKAWDFCSCFPKLGVSLTYWNWDNTEVLGHGILAIAYAEPHFSTQKRLNYFFSMGLGGAYLTKPFDENTNPMNESYSTHLNFPLMVGFGINYRLTSSWNLRLAAKYNHISNGGISTPNKGLNFPTTSLGVSKSLLPINFPNLDKIGKRQPPEDRTRLSLTHFSGWSNATVGDKDKFYVFGFAVTYSRWIGGRSALTGGTEWILDYSRRELIAIEAEDASFLQGAVLVGHEFWLGRVTFSQQLGMYYFKPFRNTDDVYQRYGLTYSFNEKIFAGVSLKAHRHVADFFDVRVGYRF